MRAGWPSVHRYLIATFQRTHDRQCKFPSGHKWHQPPLLLSTTLRIGLDLVVLRIRKISSRLTKSYVAGRGRRDCSVGTEPIVKYNIQIQTNRCRVACWLNRKTWLALSVCGVVAPVLDKDPRNKTFLTHHTH